MNLLSAIAAIEAASGDPSKGLPEDIFLLVSRIAPLINVDLLIQDDHGHTLLTWRDDEYFGAGWHVPGRIMRHKEPIVDCIRACAQQELGTDVSFGAEPLLVSESIRSQTSRGHFVSLLYRCRLLTAPDENREAGQRPRAGDWRWHGACPPDLLNVQAQYARFF